MIYYSINSKPSSLKGMNIAQAVSISYSKHITKRFLWYFTIEKTWPWTCDYQLQTNKQNCIANDIPLKSSKSMYLT